MSTTKSPRLQDKRRRGDDSRSTSQLRTRLRRFSVLQGELAENRQQVLIDRQRLVSAAKRSQKQRNTAKNGEARLMDTFRKYYIGIGNSIPEDLTLAYTKVEEYRNALVAAEIDLAENEQELELAEWKLTEQEEDLYQRDIEELLSDSTLDILDDSTQVSAPAHDLSKNTIEPSPGIQYQVDVQAYRQLKKQFNGLRKGNMAMIDHASNSAKEDAAILQAHVGTADFEQLFSDTLGQMIRSETKLQRSKAQLAHQQHIHIVKYQARSEPSRLNFTRHSSVGISRQAQSEEVLQHPRMSKSHMSYVDEWLLNCLEMNAVNRLCYMAIVQGVVVVQGQPSNHWEESALQFWLSDMSPAMTIWDLEASVVDRPGSDPWAVPEVISLVGTQNKEGFKIHSSNEFGSVWSEAFWPEPTFTPPVGPALRIPLFVIEDLDLPDSERPIECTEVPEKEVSIDGRRDAPTSLKIPAWTVTAPDDDHEIDAEMTASLTQLRVDESLAPRCDSPQSSLEQQQQHTDSKIRDLHGVESVSEATRAHLQAATTTRPASTCYTRHFETGDMAPYSTWRWSPDLHLHRRKGSGADDEVIEADWRELHSVELRRALSDEVLSSAFYERDEKYVKLPSQIAHSILHQRTLCTAKRLLLDEIMDYMLISRT